ncbi:hypothetical protein HDU88_003021 [Geranomyces variabilis]|nr:hypothetical protein HDU88_003021 [Geranomyces variabilis]
MSVQQYGRQFPILLRTPSPRGHVELLETIGKGNYGYVYKGRLLATKEVSAVKVVFLKEDELRETLLEMEILEQCNHPNITRYMGCYLKGLDLWICMEFCGGGALDSIYRAIRKPLTEDQIACIIYESVMGLDYLHTKVALIHRDIKAGNVLLTENGECKLADFGVSAKLSSVGARARTFIGTPYWMAPEVIMTDPENATHGSASYDAKADIWSIGITAIEIAEKNPPLSDIHPMRALTLIPTSDLGLAKPKNWSKTFQEFIAVCLIKDPTKRPSAAQLLAHPFLAKASGLPRQKIMTELVQKAKLAREKKKAGYDMDDDDDEDEKKDEIPAKAVAETMKQAKQAKQQQHIAPQPSARPSTAASITSSMSGDVPTFTESATNPANRVLDPVLIPGTSRLDVLTADLLDGTHVLVGTEKGLFFVDMRLAEVERQLVPLIRNTRFKQIEVLQDYGIMVALSGKHDHVRQYKLTSLRKLIMYIEGANAQNLARMENASGIAASQIRTGSKFTSATGTTQSSDMSGNRSPSTVDGEDDMYRGLHNVAEEDEASLVARWTGDYIKIIATRDTRAFMIQRTETSIFMGVLFRHDIILFEWAKEPYLKFMKLKAFWLPEGPKCMEILHDGLVVREIFLGYSSEANLVNIDDSRVKEIEVQRDFREKAGKGTKAKWQTFVQIPFTEAARKELRAANVHVTVNRKLAAVARANTKANPASSKPKPDRYFLGTYHKLTRVVDLYGQIMMGSGVGGWNNGFIWREPPLQLLLRPVDWVYGLGKSGIEVVDWRSATLVQTLAIDSDSTLRALNGKGGALFVAIDRKKKGGALYWMKEKESEKPVENATSAESINDQASAQQPVAAPRTSSQSSAVSSPSDSVGDLADQAQGMAINHNDPRAQLHSASSAHQQPQQYSPSSSVIVDVLQKQSGGGVVPGNKVFGTLELSATGGPHPIRTTSNASSISSGRRSGPASPSGSPGQYRRDGMGHPQGGGRQQPPPPMHPQQHPPAGYDPRQDLRNDLRHDPRNDPRYDPRNDPRNDPRHDPRHDPRNDPRYDPRNDPRYDPRAQPQGGYMQHQPPMDPRYAQPPAGYGQPAQGYGPPPSGFGPPPGVYVPPPANYGHLPQLAYPPPRPPHGAGSPAPRPVRQGSSDVDMQGHPYQPPQQILYQQGDPQYGPPGGGELRYHPGYNPQDAPHPPPHQRSRAPPPQQGPPGAYYDYQDDGSAPYRQPPPQHHAQYQQHAQQPQEPSPPAPRRER